MGLPVPYMPVPARRASICESTCPQCGAPHEPQAAICGYCLTPKTDAAPVEMIEVTTLGDAQPRYRPLSPLAQPAPIWK